MDKRGRNVLIIVVLAAFIGIAVIEFVSMKNGTQSPIRSAVRGMLDAPEPAPDPPPSEPAQKPAQKDGRQPPSRSSPPAGSSSSAPIPRLDLPALELKSLPAPVVIVPKPQPSVSNAAPVFAVQQRRSDTFVPGNLRGWIGYGITFDQPLLVRAGGELRAGDEIAGPNGLKDVTAPRAGGRTLPDTRVRVLPAASYLALIGRVCSNEECSAPFVIGAHAVLCPSALGVTGDLQLWTNNFVQVDGYQTLASYTAAAGGYRFQAEPAPASACDNGAAATAPGTARDPGTPLPDEQPLKDPGFSVSSRQNSWKPFFLPMDRAFVIRASGQMQPLERVRATGPNGIEVPANASRWTYPGAKNVVIDADHVLLEKGLPYQALIGRLCGPKECGDPFLIGAERTICPSTRYNERIELWINHIVPRTSERHLPFASLTFQSRRGEYRFEIATAPPCGGRP
jgi:hypothetical protein